MIIMLPIQDEHIEAFVRYAIIVGFLRANPELAWNEREKRDAIKYAIGRMMQEALP